ncbi:hypothetical protein [Paenibacillus sp. L3-i20]|uniref:hypothetical protein n=1 Tax=Paenibacillus sp. L3-i20 TaxID=2905833 RepID=UPI001EE02717|nr:hypothetical protein [Paenibacillus sp. L3-i20]GKU79284.1 hypothetical protein L3i20_v236810 [Paenibacillus sp. L3-i20]
MAGGKTDKTLALLETLVRLRSPAGSQAMGLYTVEVKTSDPYPITFVMQGTKLALGLDIFEVPVDFYPLREGDQLVAFPLVGGTGGSNRWAILAKLTSGLVMATMQSADSCKPDRMAVTYNVTKAPDLVLSSGDRVAIAPTWDGSKIAYAVLNKY